MVNAFKEAAVWMAKVRDERFATTVEVHNGEETIEVPATISSTRFRTFDENDNYIYYTSVDFVVTAGRLVFGGVPRLPTRSWRVRACVGLSNGTYQLSAPSGEQCFKYDDPHGVSLRLHTLKIGTE
jgi:hypothetical protein